MSDKLTIRERIASVEVLKGKKPVQAVTVAGYSQPEKNATHVGEQIANSTANPFHKRQQYADTAITFLYEAVSNPDMPTEPMSWADRLRATDILLKYTANSGETGDTFNTLVLGDISAMDEGTLLRTLQQLRAKASNSAISHGADMSSAPQEGISAEGHNDTGQPRA